MLDFHIQVVEDQADLSVDKETVSHILCCLIFDMHQAPKSMQLSWTPVIFSRRKTTKRTGAIKDTFSLLPLNVLKSKEFIKYKKLLASNILTLIMSHQAVYQAFLCLTVCTIHSQFFFYIRQQIFCQEQIITINRVPVLTNSLFKQNGHYNQFIELGARMASRIYMLLSEKHADPNLSFWA